MHKGFTLLETLVALGIGSILALGSGWLFVTTLRSSEIMTNQLTSQSDGRRVLQTIVNDVRRSAASSIGAFPIETAATSTLTLYANIDSDGLIERVRYFREGQILRRGVTKPSGMPLQYLASSESIVDIANFVVNGAGTPIFTYFDESYLGSEPPIPEPVSTARIHLIRVFLELEKDIAKSPAPVRVESMVQVRNLKTN